MKPDLVKRLTETVEGNYRPSIAETEEALAEISVEIEQ